MFNSPESCRSYEEPNKGPSLGSLTLELNIIHKRGHPSSSFNMYGRWGKCVAVLLNMLMMIGYLLFSPGPAFCAIEFGGL